MLKAKTEGGCILWLYIYSLAGLRCFPLMLQLVGWSVVSVLLSGLLVVFKLCVSVCVCVYGWAFGGWAD